MKSLEPRFIYAECERHALEQMEKLFDSVLFTREFHLGQATDREYYKRHLLEAVIRIGLNNDVDTYCLHKIVSSNASVAKKLLDYLKEEYGHDSMIAKDLEKFGITETEILETKPLFSTKLLISFMYYEIDKEGAMPTVVWNWFVEWYSHRYNMTITQKAEQEFGLNKVRNSLAHLRIDEEMTHEDDMTSALSLLIHDESELEKSKSYLTSYIQLIGMYFQELYNLTVGTTTDVDLSRMSFFETCLGNDSKQQVVAQ